MRTIFKILYKNVVKPVVFKFDPEFTHDVFTWIGEMSGRIGIVKWAMRKLFVYENEIISQDVLGVKYKNPVGLAGGFDKDAKLTQVLGSVGFGFNEIGAVTAKAYGGNAKPRLKRYIKTKSIWVNYGLKNKGAKAVHEDLKKMLDAGRKFEIPLWINVAKTNCSATADQAYAVEDYSETVRVFSDMVDVFVINISCPNTFGGQPFHKPEQLEALLSGLDKVKTETSFKQPYFLKLSPELSEAALDSILKICDQHQVDGLVISNLSKKKNMERMHESERVGVPEHGSLSGKYVEPDSDRVLEYVGRKVKKGECKKYVIVGVGGIFTAEDAYKKIRFGASLVELITGMIFEGPQVMSEINEGLAELLKKDGFKHISEAVGVDL
ncbi:quinone-dependent dihydroorotate dehydrogenase [Candidatus Peregrinibacteria bacterium]|jgi:dihydroorotate dehydrogenase|nr:quinone-dependent dihydroorotate dehydrogenase [Candidatus Peregrinibacteria bacterium]